MPNFITNINWSSPMTIGITIGAVALIAVGGYIYWAWSKNQWPFI